MTTKGGSAERTNARRRRPRLGVSTCLLGENVRYDGAEKRDPVLLDAFGGLVDWVPICPEVECGMTVPRDPMHLGGDPASPRLVTTATGQDQTERMQAWMRARLEELEDEKLWGFVLKSNSPSCGTGAVPVLDDAGARVGAAAGLFAAAVAERFPLLPTTDERSLRNDSEWDSFIERLFLLRRYRDSAGSRRSPGSLAAFHAAHRLQLMAHSPAVLQKMDGVVANPDGLPPGELADRYEKLLVEALTHAATPGSHTDVLLNALRLIERGLSSDEKRAAIEAIEDYRGGRAPLTAPLGLLGRHIRSHSVDGLAAQSYFTLDPVELRLRSRF